MTLGDEESPDEAMYRAPAMQFIGFRSVIGTMWAVDEPGRLDPAVHAEHDDETCAYTTQSTDGFFVPVYPCSHMRSTLYYVLFDSPAGEGTGI